MATTVVGSPGSNTSSGLTYCDPTVGTFGICTKGSNDFTLGTANLNTAISASPPWPLADWLGVIRCAAELLARRGHDGRRGLLGVTDSVQHDPQHFGNRKRRQPWHDLQHNGYRHAGSDQRHIGR